jgi:four helix bundle protein
MLKLKGVLQEKSYAFAIRIVKASKHIATTHKEFDLSRQLLRCGTSVGACIREAEHAQSQADFIHKLSIALKEANETTYWISILKDTEYITQSEFDSLIEDAIELTKMLISAIKTSKSKL